MAEEIKSNPVMEVEVSSPMGFQPEFVDEDVDPVTPAAEDTPPADPPEEDSDEPNVIEDSTEDPPEAVIENAYTPDENEDTEEVQPQSRVTGAASLARAMQKQGGFPEEIKIPDDLKAETLIEFLDKTKLETAQKQVLQLYQEKYGDDRLKYIDYLMQGGSPEKISEVGSLVKLDIKDGAKGSDKHRKELITAMYKKQGLSQNRADRLYQDITDEGEDLKEAQEAQNYFKTELDKDVEQKRALLAQQQDSEDQQTEQINSSIRTMLQGRKINDLSLSEAQSKSLEMYMFEPSAIIDMAKPDGSTGKARVSQYYKDYNEFFKDTGNLIKLARFIQMGGKSGIDKENMALEINNELLTQLNAPVGIDPNDSNRPKVNAWLRH